MTTLTRFLWAGILAGLLLTTAGCGLLRMAGGPRLATPAESVALDQVTDHRDKTRLLFAVLGDSGTGKVEQREVGEHLARECETRGDCDFALLLGDNIYEVGVRPEREMDGEVVFDKKFRTRFEEPFAPVGRLDFWTVAGNHDWYTKGSVASQVRYSEVSERWRQPAEHFEVPRLPEWIRIYGLETMRIHEGDSGEQIDRARAALCGDTRWRLLFGHHPVYSSGMHGNRRGVIPPIRDALLEPLIAECGVQIYFAGHDHHQEHLVAAAFDQVVQGAAGKLRRVHEIENRDDDVVQLAGESRYGFALVEVTPETLEMTFFGFRKNRPFEAFHCRSYSWDDFADPAGRSRPCEEID